MSVSTNRIKIVKVNREYTPYELKSISARVLAENSILLLVNPNKWHMLQKIIDEFANRESRVFVIS